MSDWGRHPGEENAEMRLRSFQRSGEALFTGGLNNSHSGNLSVRIGDTVWITATRTMCHKLGRDDIVAAPLDGSGDRSQLSREAIVHEAVYRATDYQAVVHCHPRDAIAAAFVFDDIPCLQIEGQGALKGLLPVIEVEIASASPELGAAVAQSLQRYPAVMVRGHGLFAGGASLDQATHRAFVANETAYFYLMAKRHGADVDHLLARPYIRIPYGTPQVSSERTM